MSERLRAIAAAVGGTVNGSGANVAGPGHSRRDRSLSLYEIGPRILWNSFAGDSNTAIAAHLQACGIEIEAGPMSAAVRRRVARRRAAEIAEQTRVQIERASAVWRDGHAPEPQSPTRTYLARRGIPASAIAMAIGEGALREHRSERGAVTMLALARNADDKPRAVQMTRLKRDGSGKWGDPPRFTFGPVKGCAVRLLRPYNGELTICEGVETALAFYALHKIPAWATLGTANLASFTPPPGIKRLWIAADGDPAGRTASEMLFDRLRSRVRCTLAPAPEGLDWADVLALERKRSA